MKTFRYTHTDSDGNKGEGTVKAADKAAALERLSEQGLVVIELEEDRGPPSQASNTVTTILGLVFGLCVLLGGPYWWATRGAKSQSESHALLVAIGGNKVAQVTELIASTPHVVGIPGLDGVYPLHLAVAGAHPDMVKVLLDARPNLEVKDPLGATPLMWAVENNSVELVGTLLEKGADLEATDADGNRPLHYATKADSAEMVELLLAREAELEAGNTKGETPLHVAAANDSPSAAEALLQAGAELSARDKSQKTPLHHAGLEASFDAATLLLEKGADPKAVDDAGLTPSDLASAGEFQDVARLLDSAQSPKS